MLQAQGCCAIADGPPGRPDVPSLVANDVAGEPVDTVGRIGDLRQGYVAMRHLEQLLSDGLRGNSAITTLTIALASLPPASTERPEPGRTQRTTIWVETLDARSRDRGPVLQYLQRTIALRGLHPRLEISAGSLIKRP